MPHLALHQSSRYDLNERARVNIVAKTQSLVSGHTNSSVYLAFAIRNKLLLLPASLNYCSYASGNILGVDAGETSFYKCKSSIRYRRNQYHGPISHTTPLYINITDTTCICAIVYLCINLAIRALQHFLNRCCIYTVIFLSIRLLIELCVFVHRCL